jgi:quercetin dioxygenase-like cupin family protein
MTKLSAGVTRASEGLDGVIWNILGQTYTLKEESDAAMGWHALLPPGSFVPPHIHPIQDEFIYMIEGQLDLQLGEQKSSAGPGDLIRLPMNEPHGLFNTQRRRSAACSGSPRRASSAPCSTSCTT